MAPPVGRASPRSLGKAKPPVRTGGRLPFEASCCFAVSDMLQHSFDGGWGELEKKIVKPVSLQHKPPPVNVASLPKSQTVAIQAGAASGFAVRIEKEGLQDVVNLFRRGFDGITVFSPVPLDGQKDVDGQPHLERDDNGRIGGAAEVNRQRAIVCCARAGKVPVRRALAVLPGRRKRLSYHIALCRSYSPML